VLNDSVTEVNFACIDGDQECGAPPDID